jgi:DEAD/DEAH box helicase domain-containing protein
MTTHTGIVDWYSHEGYGVIRDAGGSEYFVHHRHVLPEAGALQQGQRVTFEARLSKRRKGGFEAYNVAPAQDDTPIADADALEIAAAEVLRFKREVREGKRPDAGDPFKRNTSIVHPAHGRGQIVFTTKNTVTVEFENDLLTSFSREQLKADLGVNGERERAEEVRVELREVAPTATPFTRFMAQLRRDTLADLTEEGIDTSHIYHLQEGNAAAPASPLESLDSRVQEAFAAQGITSFFTHQQAAYDALRSGKSAVLSTPTASGKTAGFTPAILHTLLEQRGATALYVFPLVALAGDQTEKLLALNEALPADDRFNIGVLNSSVSSDEKWDTLKRDNHLVVTTPDTLHYRLLPNAFSNWERFFGNLRYLVLDEAHIYKGAFGANVANIVRRVVARTFRLSRRAPQIVISSATVRDPMDLAVRLTGYKPESFVHVGKSGARTPRRHFLITREPAQDICADLMDVNTTDAFTGQPRPARVIVFTRSIQGAKAGCERLREQLRRRGRSDLAAGVADFYSDKADKNDIFSRLRNGEIQCIFSTTALMAGIDIGSLDVVIVDGFPGLVMDARQMFGRAGRAGEGAAIFVAHKGNPFDEFYLDNPDLLFKGDTEPVIVNPHNPLLLAAHVLCAAHTSENAGADEGPLGVRAAQLFGEEGQVVISSLESQGKLVLRDGVIHTAQGAGKPHDAWPLNDLRATNDREPLLLQTQAGRLLEKKRRALAMRDTHPDAIFVNDGQKYRVVQFPKAGDPLNQILCEPVKGQTDLYTQGVEEWSIRINKVVSPARVAGPMALALADVTVKTSVSAYRRIHTRNVARCVNRRCKHETPNIDLRRCPRCNSALRAHQIDDPEPLPIPITGYDLSTELNTQAAWIELGPAVQAAYDAAFWPRWQEQDREGNAQPHPGFLCAVASVAGALLKAFPECANCDRDDIAGLPVQHQTAWRIFLYDNFPQGLGLAAEFERDVVPYLQTALTYVERCTCDDAGCPVCLFNFRARQHGTLSKLAARFLLRHMLGQDVQGVIDDLELHTAALAPSQLIAKPKEM